MENNPVTPVETKDLPDSPASARPKKKKRKIAKKIILIFLALIVLTLLGGYTYWVIKGSKLDLPYGLKGGMTLAELRQVMTDNGFLEENVESQSGKRYEHEVNGETKEFYSQASDTIDYAPVALYDVMSDNVSLEKREKAIRLTFYFDSALYQNIITKKTVVEGGEKYTSSCYLVARGNLVEVYKDNPFGYCYSRIDAPDGTVYNCDNPTPEFEHLLSELTAEYGSPAKNIINGRPYYEWNGIRPNLDRCSISISFYNDTGYTVRYEWEKSSIF